MSAPDLGPDSGRQASRRAWIAAAAIVVAAATATRVAVNFLPAYTPIRDGGYYPLQVRTWLLQGRLMYDDLPLYFWINAAMAKILMAFGQSIDVATLEASRVIDSILQPWAAVPLLALGYRWTNGARRALPGCIAGATLAVLSPPILDMTSRLQKNSLGLVWMAAAAWACDRALRRNDARSWISLAAIVALSAMTHIGAFAVTALTTAAAIGIWTSLHFRRMTSRERGRMLTGLAAGSAAAMALVTWLEPRRAASLLHPFSRLGPPRLGFVTIGAAGICLVVAAVSFFAMRRLWSDRHRLDAAQFAVASATLVAALLLAAPIESNDSIRLALLAPIPGVILLIFLAGRGAVAGNQVLSTRALLAATTAIVVATSLFVRQDHLAAAGGDELRALRPSLGQPESVLIAAPGGLQWWGGYFLHTRVRRLDPEDLTSRAALLARLPDSTFDRYRIVLILGTTQGTRSFRTAAETPPEGFAIRRIHEGDAFELYELTRQ